MRTEELIKEAREFSGDEDCYIHYERVNGGPSHMIYCAEPGILLEAVAELLVWLEMQTKLSRFTILWKLRKMFNCVRRENKITDLSEEDD